jgi:hypothetical protein
MYTTEQELVDTFLEKLLHGEPWEASKFGTEFNYLRGKTDIIAISLYNEVIAIEAKLSKWRSALQQAYRNRCFADKSYVLLPLEVAKTACQHEHEFKKRGVGICSIQNGHITILREAIIDEPIQPWLRQVAFQYAMEG